MAEGTIKYVGVDGATCGWFSVGLDDDSGCEVRSFPTFSGLVDYYSNAELILVDMPIGLLESGKDDRGCGSERCCDKEARKKLTRRSGSVFPVPTRLVVHAIIEQNLTFEKAMACAQSNMGKGISKQTYYISPKIAEVDNVVACRDQNASPQIREVHPEICFWAFNSNQDMSHSKNESREVGIRERLEVLQNIEVKFNYIKKTRDIYEEALSRFRRNQVSRDDIVDALVAAVTAKIVCKQPSNLGAIKSPDPDSKCLPMEMVYVTSD